MPRWLTIVLGAALACSTFVAGFGWWASERRVLPGTVYVTISEAGLAFRARLDSGAVVSSINAHGIKVIDGEDEPSQRDAGKLVSFVLVNERGERHELTARIAEVRGVRSADCREVRYHVYLTIEFRGQRHRILTNLNDRAAAADKLLLGQNWLRHGYAVDVNEDASE